MEKVIEPLKKEVGRDGKAKEKKDRLEIITKVLNILREEVRAEGVSACRGCQRVPGLPSAFDFGSQPGPSLPRGPVGPVVPAIGAECSP